MGTHHIKFSFVLVLALILSSVGRTYAESTGQYIDDATTTAKVKAALLADKQLKSMQINVETNQGVVQLSGALDDKSQESEAIKVANQVEGVKSVQDLMSIKGSAEE